MDTGTYGLTTSVRQGGTGANLMTLGAGEERSATSLLGQAAEQDSARLDRNKVAEQQAQAGNSQLGASAGALAGSTFGPWGTLIGGALGGIAAGHF